MGVKLTQQQGSPPEYKMYGATAGRLLVTPGVPTVGRRRAGFSLTARCIVVLSSYQMAGYERQMRGQVEEYTVIAEYDAIIAEYRVLTFWHLRS